MQCEITQNDHFIECIQSPVAIDNIHEVCQLFDTVFGGMSGTETVINIFLRKSPDAFNKKSTKRPRLHRNRWLFAQLNRNSNENKCLYMKNYLAILLAFSIRYRRVAGNLSVCVCVFIRSLRSLYLVFFFSLTFVLLSLFGVCVRFFSVFWIELVRIGYATQRWNKNHSKQDTTKKVDLSNE